MISCSSGEAVSTGRTTAHALAQALVGRGHHHDFCDLRERRNRSGSTSAAEMFSPPRMMMSSTVGDRQEAVGVDDTHVARAVPAVGVVEGVLCERRVRVADAEVRTATRISPA